ncbi:MAG TPA: DeoR/GlpR family DNA-binding transcription regulator [Roseiflexaceae bacterium]|nr:DeoR/GlpR family DNA-binding transcription regulator [Roseiflexaceae bacterium]
MTGRLFTKQRQRAIAEVIARDGHASVDALCQLFDVSPATIRRDLDELDTQGVLIRTHGGAMRISQAMPELPVLQRGSDQSEAKRRIGKAAAALVPEGATVFIASGTTTLEVARALASRSNLTVITNALNVACLLADAPGITLVICGGVLRQSELSLLGHLTNYALSELRTDMVFIGAHAVSIEQGLSADNLAEVMTDRAILDMGVQRVLVADHSKFGKFATARVAPLSAVHTVITDGELDATLVEQLHEHGMEVIVA